MDAAELLNELQSNPDGVIKVLEKIGHHDIKDKGYYWQMSNIDGDNPTALCIKKEELIYSNFSHNKKGSFYSLVMDELGLSFPEAINYIAKCIGFKGTNLHIHKPFHGFYEDILKTETYPELSLKRYSETDLPPNDSLSKMWLDDGVDLLTQEKFGIRIDHESNRIIIPEYDYYGNLIGAKARYNGECELENRWSMYIPYSKSFVIYGYHQHYENIQKKQVALVLEAEKSVLQAESMNCHIGLAIGGHDISSTQALYLKRLGVDVIIGFDAGIDKECCEEQARKVLLDNRIWKNKVGYINMSDVPDKNSPTDMGYDEFRRLMKTKITWIEEGER